MLSFEKKVLQKNSINYNYIFIESTHVLVHIILKRTLSKNDCILMTANKIQKIYYNL